jgi:hypothetical protein
MQGQLRLYHPKPSNTRVAHPEGATNFRPCLIPLPTYPLPSVGGRGAALPARSVRAASSWHPGDTGASNFLHLLSFPYFGGFTRVRAVTVEEYSWRDGLTDTLKQ